MKERRSIEVIKNGRPKIISLLNSDKKWLSKEITLLFSSDKKMIVQSSLSRSSYDPSNVQKDLQTADTKKSLQKYYHSWRKK